MNIQEQKNITIEVLKLLDELGFESRDEDSCRTPQLMAAGGCIINWDLDIPANDIDLWIRHDAVLMTDTFEDAEHIMEKLDVTLKNKTAINVSGHSYEGIGRISAVYGFTYKGLDFDIIFHGLEDPRDGFDSSINKAGCWLNPSRDKLEFNRCMGYADAFRSRTVNVFKHETDTVDRYLRRVIKQYKKFSPLGFKVYDETGNEMSTDDFECVKKAYQNALIFLLI